MTALLGLVIYIACSFFLVTPPFGVRRNISDSLPYTYFFSRPFREIQRDQYVSFTHPKSQLPLAKRIVGIPGDTISYRNSYIFLNDQNYGEILPKSASGLRLTPLSERVVPEGYVFVHAFHRESFDSRYQEFGLIPVTNLKETLWPIY